jgi:hypothetical protein
LSDGTGEIEVNGVCCEQPTGLRAVLNLGAGGQIVVIGLLEHTEVIVEILVLGDFVFIVTLVEHHSGMEILLDFLLGVENGWGFKVETVLSEMGVVKADGVGSGANGI